MTVDEELNILDDCVRRLKVEYDIFFGGGSKKPPTDIEWRVKTIVKKFSDGHNMSYQQRFRYNAVAQKYAIYSDLWRQKMKIKEEGYRRPQDALLAIQGLRTEQEHQAAAALQGKNRGAAQEAHAFAVECSDPLCELDKVRALFHAISELRQQAGQAGTATIESFQSFLAKKTEQIRKEYGCQAVEYSVAVEEGQVRLRAKAKIA